MTKEAGEVFVAATDAIGVIIAGLMEWATMLPDREHAEALHHIGKLTTDFRTLMTAVSDWAGVE